MGSSGHDGYDEIFRAEYDTIVRAAFLVTGEAETTTEVAQDAFAELYVRWHKIRDYDRPGAWVRRVAVRGAIRVSERDRRRRELTAAPISATTGDTPDLEPALAALSPKQRAAVVLHYFEDLSVDETAETMGCAPSTASVHLHRARARLAEVLGEEVTIDAV
jgi:RNA polymerase sigma-70 factor, ECF subfamily